MTAEGERVAGFGKLDKGLRQASPWYTWGPYVSERQWGTVREDYSEWGSPFNRSNHKILARSTATTTASRGARTSAPLKWRPPIGRMPIQRWRCPVAWQVKSAVFAAAGVAVAAVFFPLWFAVPVMAVLAIWGLGMCVRRSEVVLDADSGLLVVRLGPIARRVRLASITAVQVDQAKVSIARSDGWEISVYAWRKGLLDGWLRVPVVAGEMGHAISKAAAAAASEARVAADAPAGAAAPGTPNGSAGQAARRAPMWRRSRGAVAIMLLGCVGLVEVVAALLVRVSWPNPVMTALGVVLALALGLSGVFYVLFSLWLLVTRLTPRASRDRASLA